MQQIPSDSRKTGVISPQVASTPVHRAPCSNLELTVKPCCIKITSAVKYIQLFHQKAATPISIGQPVFHHGGATNYFHRT